MSNTAKKILQETFSSWMKKITKEYQKKYGFDMGENNDVTWNNEGDAFRHVYMQAFLSIYMGENVAEKLGNEHETEGRVKNHQSSNEENMDLWNNNQGREIAKEINDELFRRYGYKVDVIALYPTIRKMIAAKTYKRMKVGKLITHPSDPRRYVPKNKNGNTTGQAAPISNIVTPPKPRTELKKTKSQNFSDIIRQKYKIQQTESNKTFNKIFKSNSTQSAGDGHWVTMNGAHIFIEDK